MRSTTSPFHSILFGISLAVGVAKGATLSSGGPIESDGQVLPFVAGDGGLSEDSTNLLRNAGIAASWAVSDPTSAAAYVERMVSNNARDAAASVYLKSIILGNSQGRNDSLLSAIEIWQALADSGENEIIIEADRYRGDRTGRRGDQTLSSSGLIAQYWFSQTPSGGIPLTPGNSLRPLSFGDGSFVNSGGTLVDLIGEIPLIDFYDLDLLQSVPEPSSLLLGTFGVLGLLRRRRP